MADLTDVDRLRRLLGEAIPVGGSDADTLFSNAEVDDLLARGGGDLNLAAALGWEAKAAEFANLVSVAEGSARKELSDLRGNALAMVKHFRGGSSGGRVRIHAIRRRGEGSA